MNVKNCRRCGRLFNYVMGPPICPACKEDMEHKFQEVKEYIRQNKNSGIAVVANECEVEVAQIQQWIREERLVFSEDSPIGINCENCGAMIRTGRFCDKCKNNMAHNLSSVIPKQEKPSVQEKKDEKVNPKMRFL